MTRTEAKRMMEDEAEDAIRRQSEECAADRRVERALRAAHPFEVRPEDWVMPG